MTSYWIVFIGGGLGAAARLGITSVMSRYAGLGFPWGTLTVNCLGALFIGFLVEVCALRFNLTSTMRSFLVTGILGGFTTFSAFVLEASAMTQRGDYGAVIFYILVSVLGGMALFILATHTVRAVF